MKTLIPLVLTLALSGCVRSNFLRQDEVDREDESESYYQPAGNSVTGAARIGMIKQPKKKVLVLGFWNDTPVGDDSIGMFAAEELKRELILKKKVIFPEEKISNAVTRDFVEGDRIQTAQLVREGKRVGVNTIIVGRISKIIFRQDREEVGILREAQTSVAVDVEMKVFDAATGREVHQAKRTGLAENVAHIMFDDDALSSKSARMEIAKDAVATAIRKITGEVLLSLEKWTGRAGLRNWSGIRFTSMRVEHRVCSPATS